MAGRKQGSRNKGYFHRKGRGWFTKVGGLAPLTDEEGNRLRNKSVAEGVLKAALARHRVALQKPKVKVGDELVGAVCAAYLENLKAEAGEIEKIPTGKAKTYIDRGQILYDFCYGLPAEYFCGGDKEKREQRIKDKPPKRIHEGFGHISCSTLTPADMDTWLNAHKWTSGGRRTRIQAIKRAFNFGVERKMIPKSPIRGYRIPKSIPRVTYLTPDQETAMREAASPAFAEALHVCIRTGARFGCEFAALEKRHIRDHGDKMEWVFRPEESKTGKLRRILISDPEIMRIVRERMTAEGPIFRNKSGTRWETKILSHNFRRVKERIKKKGVILDPDACMYSCRHTYAKRTLEGYWTGKATSIQTLARLMGNSVKVCMDHYLQFSHADNEMLWEAC